MSATEIPPELRAAVAKRDIAVVAGSGVSIAATGDPDGAASWRGLILHGLNYANSQGLLDEKDRTSARALLEGGYFGPVAGIVRQALLGRRQDWLNDAFRELRVAEGNTRLLDAIAALSPPLVLTTNYDSILGEHLRRFPISWTNQTFFRALTEPDIFPTAILHLHGHWSDADTVVLDPSDYERFARRSAMEALQSVAATRPLVFIGCGPDGLDDLHFRELWAWLKDLSGGRQHYAFLPDTIDSQELRKASADNLRFILYPAKGKQSHTELSKALERLVTDATEAAEHLHGVGRLAVGGTETTMPRDVVRISVVQACGFDNRSFWKQKTPLPLNDDRERELSENLTDRIHRLLVRETRGANLCVVSSPPLDSEVSQLLQAADSHVLAPWGAGGMVLGSNDGASHLLTEATTFADIDFHNGVPANATEGVQEATLSLRVTPGSTPLAERSITVVMAGDGNGARLCAPSDWWPDDIVTFPSPGIAGMREIALPADTDAVLAVDLVKNADGTTTVTRVQMREVIYGLDQTNFAALSRIIEGEAPLDQSSVNALAAMLAGLDDRAFSLLRKDLSAYRLSPDSELFSGHIAAQGPMRSAPEALYEALADDTRVRQDVRLALLPWVRAALRRAADAGAVLAAQEGSTKRLLVAASLGQFDLESAPLSFARQRTLLAFVAEQDLTLTYTLRSRVGGSAADPGERRFLIHCFASPTATGSRRAARESVASIVQSTFHDAYGLSYSVAVREDVDDVRVAAGESSDYAQVAIVPTSASGNWPVSDYGLIADYIRTLSGDVAVTWECRRDSSGGAEDDADSETRVVVGSDGPSTDLARLAFDVAYRRGSVRLQCRVAVRGFEEADGDVAREVAALVGTEVFGTGCFQVVKAAPGDTPSTVGVSVSPGHALLAMHAPFGRLYATSFDTPRRYVRTLKDQQFASGIALGTATRKAADRDYEETVTLSDEERFHHVHVVGRPGVGKTTLLKRMILGDLEAGNGVTVVDPHGGLADWVIEHLPHDRVDDAVLVDLDVRSAAPVLNPLDVGHQRPDDYDRVVGEIIHFTQARNFHQWSGPVFGQLVRLTLASMKDAAYPVQPALTDLVLILTNEAVHRAVTTRLSDPELRDGWSLQSRQDPKHYAEARQWVTAKFDELTKETSLRAMFGGIRSTLDVASAVNEGRILIFRLAPTWISEQAADFIGSMLLTTLQTAILDVRSAKTRPPHFVYIDEFHRFATLGLERLVVEARKFRVGMTLAHQNLEQLAGFDEHTGRTLHSVPSTLVGNAGTLVVFPVSSDDRDRLARELGCSSAEIGELARFQALCRMAVGTGSIQPFTLEVQDMGEPGGSERTRRLHSAMRERGMWVPVSQGLNSVAERHGSLRVWAESPSEDAGTARPSGDAARGPTPSTAASAASASSPALGEASFMEAWVEKRRRYVATTEAEEASPPTQSDVMLRGVGRSRGRRVVAESDVSDDSEAQRGRRGPSAKGKPRASQATVDNGASANLASADRENPPVVSRRQSKGASVGRTKAASAKRGSGEKGSKDG